MNEPAPEQESDSEDALGLPNRRPAFQTTTATRSRIQEHEHSGSERDSQKSDSQEGNSQESDSQERDSQEGNSQESDSQERDSQERDSQERDSQERDSQERDSQERDSQKSDSESAYSESLDEPAYQDPEPELTTEVMHLCKLVLTQNISLIKGYYSPLLHYLAIQGIAPQVQGIDPQIRSSKLRGPSTYTPILAGTLWINRLLILEIALPSTPWPELGFKRSESNEVAQDQIETLCTKHLCEGSHSPTSTILSQLAYGMRLNRLSKSPSNIHWSHDLQVVNYLGLPVDLRKIRSMWVALFQELQEALLELTLDAPTPSINLESLHDTTSEVGFLSNQGYSFMDHPKHKNLWSSKKKRFQYLLKRASQNKGQFKVLRKKPGSHELEWCDPQVRAYLMREIQFLRLLMVCMHITGGQPARGPELGSVKITNSRYSQRNIYILNGRVSFLTIYDKVQKKRGDIEHILRFLPHDLGQILVQYLVYVHPFARAMDKKSSEYLFISGKNPWAGDQLTQKLKSVTKRYLGLSLTTQAWRHVAIAIANQHLILPNNELRIWEREHIDDEEDEAFAEGIDEGDLERNVVSHIS